MRDQWRRISLGWEWLRLRITPVSLHGYFKQLVLLWCPELFLTTFIARVHFRVAGPPDPFEDQFLHFCLQGLKASILDTHGVYSISFFPAPSGTWQAWSLLVSIPPPVTPILFLNPFLKTGDQACLPPHIIHFLREGPSFLSSTFPKAGMVSYPVIGVVGGRTRCTSFNRRKIDI